MKTKKLKRDKIAKITSRIALIVMCFMLIVPLGVSAAIFDGEILTVTNTNNIPQDFSIINSWNSHDLIIGENTMNGEIISIKDGVAHLSGPSYGYDNNVPSEYDGQYMQIYFYFISPSDYNATLVPVDPLVTTRNGENVLVIMDEAIFNVEEYDQDGLQYAISYCVLVRVPPEPTPTTPILDVWTGITNWITSSLNSVLGLFWEESIDYSHLDYGQYILNDTLTMLPTDSSYSFNAVTYTGPNEKYDGVSCINTTYNDTVGDYLLFSRADSDYSSYVYNFSNNQYITVYSYAKYLTVFDQDVDSVFGEWFINNSNYAEVNNLTATGHLTFLGTITIIGVSIACAFLIIGIIQRFLKLRG